MEREWINLPNSQRVNIPWRLYLFSCYGMILKLSHAFSRTKKIIQGKNMLSETTSPVAEEMARHAPWAENGKKEFALQGGGILTWLENHRTGEFIIMLDGCPDVLSICFWKIRGECGALIQVRNNAYVKYLADTRSNLLVSREMRIIFDPTPESGACDPTRYLETSTKDIAGFIEASRLYGELAQLQNGVLSQTRKDIGHF